MRPRVAAALLSAALVGCAGGAPPAAPAPPALLTVQVFGGFPSERAPLPKDRVALLVDSTGSMARGTGQGPSRLRATRTATERFSESLQPGSELELFVLGNDSRASCDRLATRYDGDREELVERIGGLRARGKGSLAAALDRIASLEEGGFERVVAFTALDDGCGGDLCQAAEKLAARGARLDLVLIGSVEAPPCIAEVRGRHLDAMPVPWQRGAPVAFHVESTSPEPAVMACSEAGGLPVQVPKGSAAVVVKLDPPLRVKRRFRPGTRWVLQVLDFPGLDPQERQWRWQAGSPPVSATTPEEP